MKIFFTTLIFFISINVFSQNIINTLGTGGVFSIKDGSANFLTLNQSTGQVNILNTLRLENTTSSSLGVIYKGVERFLHNYGSNNTFLGINSGNFTMSGYDNTSVGWYSMFSNTSGFFNTALGIQALYTNDAGYENTALGCYSLYSNSSGSQNTALGSYSLHVNTTGGDNTSLGRQSMRNNINGSSNTANGSQSLYANTTGNWNTAVGNSSLGSNSIGNYNTSIGGSSMYYNSSGNDNTAVGMNSLILNSSGSQNSALGEFSGVFLTTGNNNTMLGYFAQPSSGSVSNQITLGDGNISSLRCNIQTITSLSDVRDKKNVRDLSLGIDFIMKIKPRLFNWDKREWYENNLSDGSKMKEEPTAGFIAQELDEVQTDENAEWLNLVLKDNPEKLEATYGNLLPVMVKAIQELKVESEKLKVKSQNLEIENIELKKDNEDTKQMFLRLEQKLKELANEKEVHTLVTK